MQQTCQEGSKGKLIRGRRFESPITNTRVSGEIERGFSFDFCNSKEPDNLFGVGDRAGWFVLGVF